MTSDLKDIKESGKIEDSASNEERLNDDVGCSKLLERQNVFKCIFSKRDRQTDRETYTITHMHIQIYTCMYICVSGYVCVTASNVKN